MSRIVHFEIPTGDPSRAQNFYRDVFGWSFEAWEGGEQTYWLVSTGSRDRPGIDGGMMQRPQEGVGVVNTIQVDDVDAFADKVANAGGEIVVPKFAVPGVGWVVYFKDLDGHVLGMMQPDPQAA